MLKKKGRGEGQAQILNRRARFFSAFAVSIFAIIVAISAIVISISTIILTIAPVVQLSRVIALHSRLEVSNAFSKPFGDLRYAARSEEDYYYQRDDQQFRHSKWAHI
jgi:hypothetical protein